ncbi:helix-turn-helix domain-containing protein [Bradyrhizobium canariense]|uniref:DNA-binding transcriptional regulator, XRE-family HTH domain n=1 Tax=Bradyrhizobium canariense TaxID=255045 RepID=A0A1H1UZJ1_9BRAD|nr:helix-turn-helix transcriptional regulator [Bradyrhizobium canariense]SDS77942.1 DNA-binding transcriptional regulator, XRE-family HTH domain [Bradyrhizobium canariense]
MKKRLSPKNTSNGDAYLGARIRELRLEVGMSQEQLGKVLGVSFQQIQKYENGSNRVSAVRLYEICRILDVPIASMFEGIPHGPPRSKKKGRAANTR